MRRRPLKGTPEPVQTSRATSPYTERYIGLAVSTGVKIMLLYLLIGAGLNFAVDWQTAATNINSSASPMMGAFDIMGAVVIFMMLCWQIPKLFSAVLGGAPALTGGDLIATGTGVIAGAAAVGSLAAGAVALVAGSGAAIGSVGAAAGAGSTSGSTASSIGFMGGGAAGGDVPPPSPSGPSGGGPKQPNPPSGSGTSNNAMADVDHVDPGSRSSSPAQEFKYAPAFRESTALAESNASNLSAIGGESLHGS
ncbi:MAG: type IV secretion system protein, partial [Acidobacteriaceae bacterium]|nr:type IV secretion system protein [Acidobacteriaceae bacterium]